jgi:toxin-antitoxin system PIN domain toxin
MILPDVNVLVFAFKRESQRHDAYAAWLRQVLAGPEEIALVDAVLAGFVRIVTNSRMYAEPAPTDLALAFVQRLRTARASRWLDPGDAVWDRLGSLVAVDGHLRGNRVPDAFLAATALTHGARLATDDRGFGRYDGLRFFHPLG